VKIFIATKRLPKLEAVQQAFAKLDSFFKRADLEFISEKVSTDAPEMPLTISETVGGAKARAEAIQALNSQADEAFFIGLEGGFFNFELDSSELYFLQSWAYVSNGKVGHFGASSAVQVPTQVKQAVVDENRELGDVIDQFGQDKNIRNKGGAFEVFTDGFLTRQQSFEQAVLNAMAPFFNAKLYR